LLNNPLLLVGLLVGVGILIAGAVMAMRERTADVSERLDRYADVSGGKAAAASAAAQAPRSSPVADRLNEAITKRGLFGGLSTQLAQADLKITPAEWLALQVIVVLAAGLLGFIINGGHCCSR
jgi:hypothetical protein